MISLDLECAPRAGTTSPEVLLQLLQECVEFGLRTGEPRHGRRHLAAAAAFLTSQPDEAVGGIDRWSEGLLSHVRTLLRGAQVFHSPAVG